MKGVLVITNSLLRCSEIWPNAKLIRSRLDQGVIFVPCEPCSVKVVEETWEILKKAVNGWLERLPVSIRSKDCFYDVWLNEEGRLQNLPFSFGQTRRSVEAGLPTVGDIAITLQSGDDAVPFDFDEVESILKEFVWCTLEGNILISGDWPNESRKD